MIRAPNGSAVIAECLGSASAAINNINYHTEALARALKAVHGGNWNVRLNHEHGWVMIVQAIQGGRTQR